MQVESVMHYLMQLYEPKTTLLKLLFISALEQKLASYRSGHFGTIVSFRRVMP